MTGFVMLFFYLQEASMKRLFALFAVLSLVAVFAINCGGSSEPSVEDTGQDAVVDTTPTETTSDVPPSDTTDVPPTDTPTDPGQDIPKDDGFVKPDEGIVNPDVKPDVKPDIPPEEVACTDPPTTWGPATYLYKVAIVTAAETAALCKDFTGDNKPDNGLGNLASYANGPLQEAIDKGQAAIMLEFVDVSDYSNASEFTMNGVIGKAKNDPFVFDGELYADEQSYQECTSEPYITFDSASITNKNLLAGPGEFFFQIPLMEMVLDLTIKEVEIKGEITEGGATGVDVKEFGTLTGKVFKDDIMAAIDALDAYCKSCDSSNPDCTKAPDECTYIPIAKNLIPSMMDLDNKTAMSTCMKYAGKKVKIIGYEPE
jgi:hypothetical protein